MTLSVKICGIKDAATAKAVVAAKADYVGLVFFPPSPRHVEPKQAAAIRKAVPKDFPLIAITVDARDAALQEIVESVHPAFLQLHGNESPQRVMEIRKLFGVPVIKALKISCGDDVSAAKPYIGIADRLLFDAKPPRVAGALPGGNGLSFDWQLLKGHVFETPWFLSGGLTAENLAKAVAESGARMVDVSSSVESQPGVKDMRRVKDFIAAAKAIA